MRNLSIITAALAAISLFSPTDAQAYGWANGFGLGVGGLYRSLDYPTEQRVPYFAAHPPVYYSAPVPRTYGFSPFAYGPDVRTPELAPTTTAATEIVNPYVPSSVRSQAEAAHKKQKAAKKNRTISSGVKEAAPGPLMIYNPFFESPNATPAKGKNEV